MATEMDTAQREIVLIEEAHIRSMMGLEILEPLPSARIPYSMVDPYILIHEAVIPITPERVSLETKHSHRGFDNLWYAISGSSSTGHSTGPGGAMERARLEAGSLLKLRTGRGVWHAEGIGQDELREGKAGTQMRGLLFWVNLARKDKGAEPSAQLPEGTRGARPARRRRDRAGAGRRRISSRTRNSRAHFGRGAPNGRRLRQPRAA
jgi:redox-sensitive bicupin YhaK (pirin superfamily)